MILYKADCLYDLRKNQYAIDTYKLTLPILNRFNNVKRRKYAFVFFNLGALHYRVGELETSRKMLLKGLRHEPANLLHQILLGDIYVAKGQNKMALSHFNDLLQHFDTTKEDRLVLQLKINRLDHKTVTHGKPWTDFVNFQLYDGFSLRIQPINQNKTNIPMKKLCLFPESNFGLHCTVMPPINIDKDKIFDEERNQYNGDHILDELEGLYPDRKQKRYAVITVIGKDLFSQETNYVFSWQNRETKVAVVSSHRFSKHVADWYEPEIIIPRRLGIQLLSTVGSLLKFPRPTFPYCPLAYPDSFYEFLEKEARLCESTLKFRKIAMQRFPGTYVSARPEKIKAFQALYEELHFN